MDPNLELFFPLDVPSELRPFVRRVMYVHSDVDLNTVIEPRPTGYQYFVWVMRGTLFREKGGSTIYGDASLFLAGQIKDHPIEIRYTGKVVMLLIEFTALGCYELFGIFGRDALNIAPEVASLGQISAQFEQTLMTRSAAMEVDDIPSRFALMCSLLKEFSEQPHVLPHYLQSAIDDIESKHGAVKLNDLCHKVGISRRQFTRRFTAVVGVPPKYFCRVIQMNKAMEALATKDKRLISEIATSAGYYDEAHLIHTVQNFFGYSAMDVADKEHPAVIKMHSSSRDL